MNRNRVPMLLAAMLLLVGADRAFAYGRGGGFRAGGFAMGGYHPGGYAVGAYHPANFAVGAYPPGGYAVGAYHPGSYAGVGYHPGVYSAGGYHPSGVVVGGYRSGLEGVHTGIATDFGLGHLGATSGVVRAGHVTTPYSTGVLAARGAAVRGNFYHYGAFNSGWWNSHAGAWRPYGWNAGRFWGWATWAGLNSWFGWTAPPLYYDYGTNIDYLGDQVYLDGSPGPTAAEYYQQAADLALSAPAAAPPEKKDVDWQPLGVFALVQAEQSDTTAVFQLAVNKAGIIRGNYYSVLTDTTLPVQGAVDRKTQRASWIVGDQKSIVYDTSIANLTKDESPLLIHFGKDKTQQWLLVRVKDSDAKAP
jgi:hypothetical protein